jgi:dolichol kinase
MTNEFNFRKHLVDYTDLVVRGLIAFFVIGVFLFVVLVGFLKMKAVYMLPIAFIGSILLSPLLSKIKLGEKIVSKYEKFLRKTFKLE